MVYLQEFIHNARVKEVIQQLRQQCILDDWQYDKLKPTDRSPLSDMDKAEILVEDILLRGTVDTLRAFRQALEDSAVGERDRHLELVKSLPRQRTEACFEQLFERNSARRITQRVTYFQDKINRCREGKSFYQRTLGGWEAPILRTSVKERVKMYERCH